MLFKCRDIFYVISSLLLCVVLLFVIVINNTPSDPSVLDLESIVTDKRDLEVLHKLGIRNFQCLREYGTEVILCSKIERKK